MARKKKTTPHTEPKLHGYIAGAGEIVEQKIADTIEENYRLLIRVGEYSYGEI